MNRRITLLVLAGLGLLLASCSFVSIHNVSQATATVQVTLPDGSGASTRRVESGDIVDVFSANGGPYSVTVLPDEAYRDLLESLRDDITLRLFEEADTLTAEDVSVLIQRLTDVQTQLDLLAEPGASCSGNLPDFETVVATISWGVLEERWIVNC